MSIRLTYDSKTIDVLIDSAGHNPKWAPVKYENRALSGALETILINNLRMVDLAVCFSADVYHDMIGFFSYAVAGNSFAMAMDHSNTGNTTLDGAANSGQAVIPLTATTGFSADDVCFIRQSVTGQFEPVTIQSVSAGVSVTADANLQFAYTSGDIFQHFDYYPALNLINKEFNPARQGGFYFWQIQAIEAV